MKKISIITIVLNNKIGLKKTIQSVINQESKDYEFIVIDGESTDGTMDIIHEYEASLSYWISEKDEGIYDAMNKGIGLSKGSYLLFLNSGDWFVNSNVVGNILQHLNGKYDLVIGNAEFVNYEGITLKKLSGQKPTTNGLLKSNSSHQATFMKRELFEKVGKYNIKYNYAGDLDWFFRYSLKYNNTLIIDDLISYVRMGGVSSSGLFKSNLDYFMVSIKYTPNILIKFRLTFEFIVYVIFKITGMVKFKRYFWKKFLKLKIL